MKIAVMGMGVAGSYLVSRLKNDHEVVGFERMDEIKHDSICAWGSIKSTMIDLCKKSGIDFEKYVVHDGKKMYVDMNNQERFQIGLHGLCTYEKLSLIKDFIKDSEVHFGVNKKLEELESEFDIIVDCTGFHRIYLPKLEHLKKLFLNKNYSNNVCEWTKTKFNETSNICFGRSFYNKVIIKNINDKKVLNKSAQHYFTGFRYITL